MSWFRDKIGREECIVGSRERYQLQKNKVNQNSQWREEK